MLRLPVVFGLALAALQAREVPRLVVPNAPDLMIRVRHVSDPDHRVVLRQTLYFQGARQRLETTALDRGAPAPAEVELAQCDRRLEVSLSPEFRTFRTRAIEDPATVFQRLRVAGSAAARQETGPEVIITIETTDTGERRAIGPFVARHVLTTHTITPPPESHEPVDVSQRDGWYVDLPNRACLDRPYVSFLTAFVIGPSRQPVRERLATRGTAETGYAIEFTWRSMSPVGAVVGRQELVEISTAPLDRALFEIPAGYRPALPLPDGSVDWTRPDTVGNRIQSYWVFAVNWVSAVFR